MLNKRERGAHGENEGAIKCCFDMKSVMKGENMIGSVDIMMRSAGAIVAGYDLGLRRTDSDSSAISNWLYGRQPNSVAQIWMSLHTALIRVKRTRNERRVREEGEMREEGYHGGQEE